MTSCERRALSGKGSRPAAPLPGAVTSISATAGARQNDEAPQPFSHGTPWTNQHFRLGEEARVDLALGDAVQLQDAAS